MSSKSKLKAIKDSYKSMNQDENWISLQKTIFEIFTQDGIVLNLEVLCKQVEYVLRSNLRALILKHYEIAITKGMIAMRELLLRDLNGSTSELNEMKEILLLDKLAELWTSFYMTKLPNLQSIFYCLKRDIRAVTLKCFCNVVLFKTCVEDALQLGLKVSNPVKQMLFILLMVHRDNHTQSNNRMRLERILAIVMGPSHLIKVPTHNQFEVPKLQIKEELDNKTNNNKDEEDLIESNPLVNTYVDTLDEMSEYLNVRRVQWVQKNKSLDLSSLNSY